MVKSGDELLRDNFKRLVDYEYTAKVEDELDDIALGKRNMFL